MKNFKIILIAFLTCSFQISYGQFGEIRGTVTDSKNGLPLPRATVTYLVNGTQKGTTTNDIGEYKIKPLVPGSYDLIFSFVTYKKQEIRSIAVNAEKTTYMDVALTADNNLPEIVIKWEPPIVDPGITSNMTIINSEDLAHSIDRDVVGRVATTSGVVQKEEGGSINIRGSRDNSTQYIVDGIKMTGPFSVPNSAIEEIIVFTGGIPAQYGDATGGIVLITTKSYRNRQ